MSRFQGKSHPELVKYLRSQGIIRSDNVENVMLQIDRGSYSKMTPYVDAPQLIGHGVTISAPHMHAHALELLKDNLAKGDRALDIGSGSGYFTACMAIMHGEKGISVGIDIVPDLIELSRSNIENDQPELLQSGQVRLLVGDGREGCADLGPYDAIHVGAASPELPQPLVDQLKVGGRLIMPIGPPEGNQNLEQIDKLADGSIQRKSLMAVRYGYLKDGPD